MGCDLLQLENAIKAEIPNIKTPIRAYQKPIDFWEEDDNNIPEKYTKPCPD